MTIREATPADVETIVRLGLSFQASTEYARHLRASEAALRVSAQAALVNPDVAAWIAERDGVAVGMIAAMLYVQPFSGALIGSEIVWWMEPEARGGLTALRLLRRAEAWALSRGATRFQMMAPTPEVGKFYAGIGYELIETHYQRSLA